MDEKMYKNFVYFVIFEMKKIILCLGLLLSFIITIDCFAQNSDPCVWNVTESCCCQWNNQYTLACAGFNCQWGQWTQWNGWWSGPSGWNIGNTWNTWNTGNTGNTWNNNTWRCDPAKIYRLPGWWTWCCPGVLDDSGHCDTSLTDVWINISTDCLLNWQCSLNIYKVLWIRKSNQNPTVLWFFQDITLATTTAILWTVMIMAIIISWLFFAFASITWQEAKRAKTILIDAFVWLLMVMWSYAIIRLIQFLATAWS